MSNINFNTLKKKEKIDVYAAIATKMNIVPFAIEKDWWVTQTLGSIFELEIGKHLVFKGGTSLSKAWNLIQRFSEDIDLAIDRNKFGFDGELSKSQITNLRKTTSKYISGIFLPDLISKFQERGFKTIKFELVKTQDSDQDPRIIEIYYPSVFESSDYVLPKLQVEIGCRSLREPFEHKNMSSWVNEYFPDNFELDSIDIPTVVPDRTFLEKIFLLHEEFQRPKEKIRVSRLSRHLYDIHQIIQTNFADKAIADKSLFETIVKHRQKFTKVGGVDYSLHQPKFVNPIPPDDFIDDWKSDYAIMQEQMIYGKSPSFDEMIKDIKNFMVKLRAVKW